jgi:predicted CXXCH cytochrome family protein
MRNGSRAVKRLLFLGVGSALVFTMGGVGPAQADNGPHMSSAQLANTAGVVIANAGAGKCASCHRAHTAQAVKLLLQAQPQLCYTCHAAGLGASTDVANGVLSGSTKTALRGGGFNTASIGSGAATKNMGALDATSGRIATSGQVIPALAAPVATTSRHEINGTTSGTAWGNGPTTGPGSSVLGKAVTLECGSCHDPHGNGNYRILRTNPVDSQWEIAAAIPASAPGVIPVTAAVAAVLSPANNIKIPDATAYGYTTTNYWLTGDANSPAGGSTVLTGTAKVTDPATDGYIQNVAAWCTTCHTRYLAPTGSYKTASGDPTFMYRHRSDANYKQGAANCITCHVSHGSNAVMAGDAGKVALPGGASAPAGDSRLLRVDNRGTCVMCHNV